MCGIIGYVGPRPVVPVLIEGLRRLEYRGYDSAGIAFFRGPIIEIKKSEGKLANVEKLVQATDGNARVAGMASCGLGHTRWATHGKPTTQNAHPHRTGSVVLVHNGIIENYQEIRDEIVAKGFQPASETDSELFGFLVLDALKSGKSFQESVRQSFLRLHGACSVVVMCEDRPGEVIGIRNGPPLVAAFDPQGGAMIASDAQALLPYTKDIFFIENGDMAVGTVGGLAFFHASSGDPLLRKAITVDWSADQIEKQGYAHYMLKEIHEQPQTLVDTLNSVLDRNQAQPFALAETPGAAILNSAESLVLSACGTSWHASLLGKYWLEQWAGISTQVELSSEYRYRLPVVPQGAVVVGTSQSGETADTLAVVQEARRQRIPALAVTNVRGSTLSREADAAFFTSAGPEIGVAATKTFLGQAWMFLLWAGHLARTRRRGDVTSFFDDLVKVPHVLSQHLADPSSTQQPWRQAIRAVAENTWKKRGFFFIGRGLNYPLALEGALKLKEIAYLHAEGYAAGELKHGPIAMIDENMVVVVIAPPDRWREKTVSNLQEVKARGGYIVGIGAETDRALKEMCDGWIGVPGLEPESAIHESLFPFLIAPALQLLSYEIALKCGTDIDQPRNLAKSVTVE
jgi:glucosamine--fructose-6-phosphate aminotransferase (isomerizing)